MMTPNRFGGFGHAFSGIMLAWGEPNFRFQVGSAVATLFASYFFHIQAIEAVAVILAIGIVLTAEVFNSSLEEFCDHVTPEEHINIARVKDLAAGAVFLSSCTAFVVGCIVFIPYLAAYL